MLQIVIPAYNEERRLPRTLRELRRHVVTHRGALGRVEVIVVDNASTDATAEVAREVDSPVMPVRVVRCTRRGKGAAVRAGLLATDADLVCFMDADGATGLDALQDAWRLAQQGADVVIGSRAVAGSLTEARHCRTRSAGATFYRRVAGRLTPGIADTQCGFKVFRGDIVRAVVVDLRACGFSFDVELLVRLRAAGARIEEMPVSWVDVPGSTFVPARHGASAFLELARIAWRARELSRPAAARTVVGARSPMPMPVPAALTAGLAAAVFPMVADGGDLRGGTAP
ncbi:glycosyltransferase [Nocardioides sp. zg-536]|uniref:Glycosyltransferase n=1 Tax=Nocardioides faecalis TaxID=2803858 RepID=A0A939BWG1_9ACTN|nr:glycosyltransferase [Nocardioides faecalis]MBM9460542.1 glycosyltransferase [Nocardioides faecalis]MBS4754395.1 glycosyltransferase [Nocardioides faecalis]QVI57526.1 glycosyltransferase [Nocardioides faecalis]